jgi:hypothetical protein
VIVTIFGWGWTVKSILYLTRPQLVDRWVETATGPQARRNFVLVGALMAAVGAVLTWHAFALSGTVTA